MTGKQVFKFISRALIVIGIVAFVLYRSGEFDHLSPPTQTISAADARKIALNTETNNFRQALQEGMSAKGVDTKDSRVSAYMDGLVSCTMAHVFDGVPDDEIIESVIDNPNGTQTDKYKDYNHRVGLNLLAAFKPCQANTPPPNM